jgi:hypothetical protein
LLYKLSIIEALRIVLRMKSLKKNDRALWPDWFNLLYV